MVKLGVFVGENGLWTFFREIYEDLAAHYETNVFKHKECNPLILSGRINRWLYHSHIRSLLKNSDVCFFEWASELLEIASQMPKYSPIVARLHSFELADWVHRINWGHVDKIVFISDAIRRKFIARFPDQAGKTVLIYNAVSVERFRPVHRNFHFSLGMLGTITPIKRIYEAILVVKELKKLGYDLTLHIGGAPFQENVNERYYLSVVSLVEKLNLQETVKFYGHVNNVAVWLQDIDIFISNSYWEGLQTALLEAMATQCYCLAHFYDGAEEVLPPENIYTTDQELMRKLIAFAELSSEEKTIRGNRLGDIVREKFNLGHKKSALRKTIDEVCFHNKP